MVQKIQTSLMDDLHPDVEVTGTVAFALDGSTYEIDLSDEYADQLRNAFAPYVGAARKVGGPRTPRAARRPVPAPAPVSAADNPDPGAVRAWAREHGIPVNQRGRIKGTVVAQFLEATR